MCECLRLLYRYIAASTIQVYCIYIYIHNHIQIDIIYIYIHNTQLYTYILTINNAYYVILQCSIVSLLQAYSLLPRMGCGGVGCCQVRRTDEDYIPVLLDIG